MLYIARPSHGLALPWAFITSSEGTVDREATSRNLEHQRVFRGGSRICWSRNLRGKTTWPENGGGGFKRCLVVLPAAPAGVGTVETGRPRECPNAGLKVRIFIDDAREIWYKNANWC